MHGDENRCRSREALYSAQRGTSARRTGAAPAASEKAARQCQGFDSIPQEKTATICLNKAIALVYPKLTQKKYDARHSTSRARQIPFYISANNTQLLCCGIGKVELTVIAPTILIEPVARGVRLEILSNAIFALRKRSTSPVYIVTRADYATAELTKWLDSACPNLYFVPSSVDLSTNTGPLGLEQFASLLDTCAEIVGPDDLANLIFLSADDYFDAFIAHAVALKLRFAKARCFAVRHRSEDLFAPRCAPAESRCIAKDAIASLAEADVTLIAFHECLEGRTIGHRPIIVLPDPWYGHLAPEQRNRARRLFGFTDETLVMVTFTESSPSVNAAQWVPAARILARSPHTHLALVGRVEKAHQPMLERFGSRVTQMGPLSDDAKQRWLLAAADVVLIPRTVALDGARLNDSTHAKPPSSLALHARTAGFGVAFDREAMRQITNSVEFLHRFSTHEMTMLRGTLERLAHDRLLSVFRKRFLSAILLADQA
ncbi:glycosyltransferase family 4 protein [Trinickia violacea]|uniref:Glycosyltransferase family 4 protein n=1 Tax=Trinickia violacea TaxID=2571746 RepID=A0A4P8IXS1_9BURK|nr:glycosyltransferase family 4 protein [Trinickia violacea]QCP54112.1 glycosyltransferase family 4 protein [Trinickia violacea]